jgi:hypothetical protein
MNKALLCKIFGHKWTYYSLEVSPYRDVRVCKHCTDMQHYKPVPGKIPIDIIWMNVVQYREKGAKLYVRGYGK